MKRKIATLLSLTMILSSMSVNAFATDPAAIEDFNVGGGSGDEEFITGGADLNAINTTVYRIVLPTGDAQKLNYIADPQGLAQLETNSSEVITNLSTNAGKVYSNSDVTIANRSSKDVKVTATVKATKGIPANSEGAADLVAPGTNLSSETTPKIELAVVVSEPEASITDKTAGASGNNIKAAEYTVKTSTDTTVLKDGYGLKVSANYDDTTNPDHTASVEIPIILKHADYVAKNNGTTYGYEVVKDSIGGAVTLSLSGTCSKEGWDSKPAVPTIGSKYIFAPATSTEITSLGADDMKVIESNDLGELKKSARYQTTAVKLVNAHSATADGSEMVVELLSDNSTVAADTNQPTLSSFTIGGENKTGSLSVDETTGKITITCANLATSKGKEVVAKISYNNKIYVAKATVVIAPTAATATATTSAITITKPDGVTLSAIGDVSAISVKKGSTDVTVTADLNEDKDKIILTPASDLTANDELVVTFTIGTVDYKATVTVPAPYVSPSAGTITGALKYNADKSATVASTFKIYLKDVDADGLSNLSAILIEDPDGVLASASPSAAKMTLGSVTTDPNDKKYQTVTLAANISTDKVKAFADISKVKLTLTFGTDASAKSYTSEVDVEVES